MIVQAEPDAKKQKAFSCAEFRANLQGGYKMSYLEHFLKLCTRQNRDFILEYLEGGGSCMELLQVLENDPNVPPILIFEIVNYVLLEIVAKYPQWFSSAHSTCLFLMNHNITTINKMLTLNSRTSERRVVLTLLATIVSFSVGMAKSVLVQVNFNATNLKLLTNNSEENSSVRKALLYFLTACLVDGRYPTISALLGKPGLLTSIVSGLIEDEADSVCFLLAAMKNHILENELVSKTVKMKVFGTHVVRGFVNLYNWSGPKGKEKTSQIDQLEKSRVSDCVHNFLLVLCTTKHGIIFRDRQLGIRKPSLNNLMLTVLNSCEKPWEHSYASELVIQICGACPDVAWNVWSKLKDSLKPRDMEQWFKAVDFARSLVLELGPDKIEYCAQSLSIPQLVHTTQILVAPRAVIKTINTDRSKDLTFEVKTNVNKFLLFTLNGLEKYLGAAKKFLDSNTYLIYKKSITEHIFKCYPEINNILDVGNVDGNNIHSVVDYLNLNVDVLMQYNKLCPRLLDNLEQNNSRKLISLLGDISNDDNTIRKRIYKVQVKIIDLCLKLDPGNFYPNSKLFLETLPLLLEAYHFLRDTKTYETIQDFLLNSTIFENSEYEISVWINSIFNSKKCTQDLQQFITQIMQLASKNSIDYIPKIKEIKKELQHETFDLKIFLKNLNEEKSYHNHIKHNNLSHVVFALVDCLENCELMKSTKSYVSYLIINLLHRQTNPEVLVTILKAKNDLNISNDVLQYLFNFENNSAGNVLEIKKNNLLGYLSKFSRAFLNAEEFDEGFFQNFFETLDGRTNPEMFKVDILNMLIFNTTNLISKNILTFTHLEKLCRYIKFLNCDQDYKIMLLKNPNFLDNFSLLTISRGSQDKTQTKRLITLFILELIKDLDKNVGYFLDSYRFKIFRNVIKIIKNLRRKESKYNDFDPKIILDVIKVFELNQEQCLELMNEIVQVNVERFLNVASKSLSILYYLLCYILNRLFSLNKDYKNVNVMLNDTGINYLIEAITFLISNFNYDISGLVSSFIDYLKLYPHLIKDNFGKLFLTILLKVEFSKENSLLLCLLLEKNTNLMNILIENLGNINFTKALIVPILDVCVRKKVAQDLVKVVYDKFEPILLKALEKPHKAGQYFEKYYISIGELMKLFFTVENSKALAQKINKFETSEPFVGYLFKTVYTILIKDGTIDNKFVNNAVLMYIGIVNNIFKNNFSKVLDENIKYFHEFLNDLFENTKNIDYSHTISNESFTLLVKFCLKFGISGQYNLLSLVRAIVTNTDISQHYLKDLMEMMTSHSEFLDLILEEDTDTKTELLHLMLEIFKKSDALMEVNYVPLTLAAYRATTTKSDRIVLSLLKMFEANPNKTNFYNYKPFLWGKAAANHYSVKSNIQTSLWRQPTTGMILDLLEMDIVLNTIKYYPLDLELRSERLSFELISPRSVYDLSFLLPLFATMLLPQNRIQTYRFTKSGALSLTTLSLSSSDKNIRGAACFVLSQFYSQLQCRNSGKDTLLWVRFVEAICRGVGVLENLKVNSFVGIFLSNMALILTNPNHIMYGPLSQYLTAKSVLDFRTIPELYTLLHSPDVNYKEHKKFILELLFNGMRTKADFEAALHSVSFKLIMENFNSCLSEGRSRISILKIIGNATKISLGVKLLCDNYGLLSWLNNIVLLLNFSEDDKLVLPILDIVSNITEYKDDYIQVFRILLHIINNVSSLKQESLLKLLKILSSYEPDKFSLTEEMLRNFINTADDRECLYYLDYKQTNVDLEVVENDVNYYLKFLTLRWLSAQK